MTISSAIVAFVLLALVPGTSVALSFSTQIPGLIGPFEQSAPGPGKEASFDFGQQFSSIDAVWIEVEAHVFAREFDVCGTIFDPQPCEHVIQLLGFAAEMDKEASPGLGIIFINPGLSFSDDPNALEGSGTDVAEFINTNVGWDFLLDGQGSVTLFWNTILGNPDRIIMNVEEPSGEILNARLIIEGTPVPEPSTLFMFGAGLLALAVTRGRLHE